MPPETGVLFTILLITPKCSMNTVDDLFVCEDFHLSRTKSDELAKSE